MAEGFFESAHTYDYIVHKRIRKRKTQNLNPARAQKLNKAVVSDYCTKLKKLLEDDELVHKPEGIYNIDEKGCYKFFLFRINFFVPLFDIKQLV